MHFQYLVKQHAWGHLYTPACNPQVCAEAGPAKCQWLFSKCLTASDTNKLSRMILPRQAVETFLPFVEDRAGLDLDVWDTSCLLWRFKLKCAYPLTAQTLIRVAWHS